MPASVVPRAIIMREKSRICGRQRRNPLRSDKGQQEAPEHRQRAQRHDQRRQAEARDEHPVDRAQPRADQIDTAKIRYHGMSGQTASENVVVMYIADTATAVKLTSIPPEISTSIAADRQDTQHDGGAQQVAQRGDRQKVRVRQRRHNAEQHDDHGHQRLVAGQPAVSSVPAS
jgi:hypothetical protein